MAEAARSTGTVKWFSAQRGFGFIAPDDGGDDLFVHQTSIRSQGFRTLLENQPVEFTVDYAEDGRAKAVDVSVIHRFRRPSRGTRGGGREGSFGWRGGGGGYWQGGYGGGSGSGACYNCGRMGHLARDCYRSGGYVAGGSRRYSDGGGGGGGGAGRCYNCGNEGHFARDCPSK